MTALKVKTKGYRSKMLLSRARTQKERIFDYRMRIVELEHVQSYAYTTDNEQLIRDYRQQIAYENRCSAFRGCNYHID